MAYVNKYRLAWSSKNIAGYIYIDEDGFSGSVTDLTTKAEGLEIRYQFKEWEDPIIGLTASFTIINDKPSIFDLLELLTAEERKYLVRIVRTAPSTITLFEGFLNCDTVEQSYLRNRPVRLFASSYMSKLSDVYIDRIETLEPITFIDIINECLKMTGKSDNIKVNSLLNSGLDGLSTGETLFNKNGVYSEIFWKDNIERDSALDIITKILKSFNCFIYWYAGEWYIERYEDIFISPKYWVEYSSGSTYSPTDTGTETSESLTPTDINTLTITGQSQQIQIIPGLKELKIKLEQLNYFNLTINDLTNIVSYTGTSPFPDIRSWVYWYDAAVTWLDAGVTYQGIFNSIHRTGFVSGSSKYYKGIHTRFNVTIEATTVINIKFKFLTSKGAFGTFSGNWEDYKFRFHYYLETGMNFAKFDPGTNSWSKYFGNYSDGYNYIEVDGVNFDDATASADVEVSIPIGSFWGSTGNIKLILGIGTETVYKNGSLLDPCTQALFGDVIITASGSPEDNDISAIVGTTFLNKKDISLSLFDTSNQNYKNGILEGDTLDDRTTTWTKFNLIFETLVLRLIRQKIQLYRISRQIISASIKSVSFFKPLSQFTDSNQSGKKFVLTNYTYKPDKDSAEVEFNEYDNDETINFI